MLNRYLSVEDSLEEKSTFLCSAWGGNSRMIYLLDLEHDKALLRVSQVSDS
jgi:hypothetical protein